MEAQQIRSIQILALEAVEKISYEAFHRQVARWYSEKFSTPLMEVMEDISERHVLQTYYEVMFEQAQENASKNDQLLDYWKQLRARILRDPLQAREEDQARDQDDDHWLAQEIQQEIAKAAKKAAKQIIKATEPPNIQSKDPLERTSVQGEPDRPPEE